MGDLHAASDSPWISQNFRYLRLAISQILAHLETDNFPTEVLEPLSPPAAIEQLCGLFSLSLFERAILLLCAGMELSPEVTRISSADPPLIPTFGLALSQFPHAHWNALHAEAPLRRWHLIELSEATTLTNAPLRINERILHFLLGEQPLDSRLLNRITHLVAPTIVFLPESQQQLVTEIVTLIQKADASPVMQLIGYDSAMKQQIAAVACEQLGYRLLSVSAEMLPHDMQQFQDFYTLWQREAMLLQGFLLIDCDSIVNTSDGNNLNVTQMNAIAQILETCQQPLFLLSRDRRTPRHRTIFSFEVKFPTAMEQRQFWLQSLQLTGLSDRDLQPQVDKLVSHFNLSPLAIQAVCRQGLPGASPTHLQELIQRLWQACLNHARPQLEELAQPLDSTATWNDLVIPAKERQILQAIVAQVRQRSKVYEQWGFGQQGGRGLGISVLFAGASGTGKTLAAEVLAHELQLNLYRIDLSSVVSKYIGETEKNLRRIFDAAELGGAILLFDEADALFGKRSEVKDSHDRYANMEVAYLLQRMEAYRGLAILTTNLRNSIDLAFLRRLRFVVQFPFPDAAQRAKIWQRVFPKHTPLQDLSYARLAKLNIAGGNIRNIALNAAFLAADTDEPVQMHHILQAVQSEYAKLERPLTDAEIKGWDSVI